MLRHGTRGGWETLPRGMLTPGLPVVLTSVSGATSHVSCVGSKELASSSPLAGTTISRFPGLHTAAFGAGGFQGGWRAQGMLPATGYV